MNRPMIVVTISAQGQSLVQTQGFAGSQCLVASQFLETALGRVLASERTAEFFQAHLPSSHESQRLKR